MAEPFWSSFDGEDYQKSDMRPIRSIAAGVALGLALLFAGAPAMAEIAEGGARPANAGRTESPGQGQSPTRVGNEIEGDVRARCWQQGREILSEVDFASAAIPPALREQAISLAGSGRESVLLPFGDTFCLLTVRP